MFILNAPFSVRCAWQIIDNFINPVTRSKIQLFSSAHPKELLDSVHPSQLLKEYGGEFEFPKESWPPTFPPQTYRDDYVSMHFTPEEFKEELTKKPQAVPTPELAAELRGKLKAGRVPPRTFYLKGGKVEKRDSLNAIVVPEVATMAEVPKMVAAAATGPSEVKLEIKDSAVAAAPVNAVEKVAAIDKTAPENASQNSAPESSAGTKAQRPVSATIEITNAPAAAPVISSAKENVQNQNVTEVQAVNSTVMSVKHQELQVHSFGKARDAETTKYKKAQSSKACCACVIF